MAVSLGKNLLTLFTGSNVGQTSAVNGSKVVGKTYTLAKQGKTCPLGNPYSPESRNQIGSNVKLPGYDPNALGAVCYFLA